MSRIKLLDQSGKPATLDLMQTDDGSHNLLITGAPGSGKTTLTTMMATSAAVQGHYVRIVTAGNRYRETTEAHYGVCQECSVFRPFSLNPFSSVVDWNQDRLGEMPSMPPLSAKRQVQATICCRPFWNSRRKLFRKLG
jgi:type IV secretory pathway VirB4 component